MFSSEDCVHLLARDIHSHSCTVHVRQPGLPTRGAQDHLVWQVDHHLAGEGGVGGGGGGGGRGGWDTSVEFED